MRPAPALLLPVPGNRQGMLGVPHDVDLGGGRCEPRKAPGHGSSDRQVRAGADVNGWRAQEAEEQRANDTEHSQERALERRRQQ